MRCPVCRSHKLTETELRFDGFREGITECAICGATWSDNHGVLELVADPQEGSFLEARSECVEGDDYGFADLLE